MPIVPQGTLNTTALVVPNLYVQIVPPQNLVLNGVPTNTVGVVGTASWGPTNQPGIVATMADYARQFGPVMPRKFDMGTHVATAVQQGASSFRCVRVTDGTDLAASVLVQPIGSDAPLVLYARYTGTVGNLLRASISPGSAAGSWRLVVSLAGQQPEVFDNVRGTGATLWQAMVDAVNQGAGPLRGPSAVVIAAPGTLTGAVPVLGSYDASGGTDGEAGVTAATLVGQDSIVRKGMYALRGQGCSIGVLADVDDGTEWSVQAAFGEAEGLYMILTGPNGDTIANAKVVKALAGIDAYAAKLMFGDWLYWRDQTNDLLRLVSPQGFVAGRLANLSPEQSSLNKPLYSIVGSQKSGAPGSGQASAYSTAELSALFQAGIDVIANPAPGGAFWGVRAGWNSSSNAAVHGDNYTRLTNYIAATLNAGMGVYIGELISTDLFRRVESTLNAFLNAMYGQGMLPSTDGKLPYSALCRLANNPPNRTALGYLQADVQVRYGAINEKFIVNLEGGQSVIVSRQTLPSGQQAA